jgi:sodium-dependent dicarboxylate transporter 2/3/5
MFPAPRKEVFNIDIRIFKQQYRELGPMSFEEKVVLIDFVLLAVLWLSRPVWTKVFSNPEFINDGVVAIAMALLLFVIPAKQPSAASILDWRIANRLPWGIVLLFGGGFALASGFKDSGLSAWMGEQLHGVSALHPVLIIAVICLMITFLTELTSNTASAQILLPVLASLAVAIKVNPLLLMIPGTVSCSFAFMLPVATPPNAIIFGTERVQISDMAKAGVLLNFIGALLITLAAYFWGTVVFGIDLAQFPEWANIK